MNVKTELEKLRDEIRRCVDRMQWIEAHKKALEELPEATFCGARLDFDRLEHAEVIKVVRKLGGKWKKTKNVNANATPTIDYEAEVAGVTVRCWGGKPPPSCRLVEVEEDVPEQVIPAHKRKTLKMICTDNPEPLLAAMAGKGAAVNNNNAEKGQ